jgi:hypothetical protein
MLAFDFLKDISPALYVKYLTHYIVTSILPLYDEFLRRDVRSVIMDEEQREAIESFCKVYISGATVSLPDDEVDVNDIHPVFEYMRKRLNTI